MSQSTLSAGIQQLETLLLVRLVDRESETFRLTRIGEEILERGQGLLRDADDLVALAQQQQDPLSGEFRLGVIPSIGAFLLPRALPELRNMHRDLKLYLYETLTRHLLDDVRAGRIDAAVIALPYQIDGFGMQSLGADQFHVALPYHHPLASKAAISALDLRSEPLILLDDGHCIRDHILTSLKRADLMPGEDRREQIVATSLMTVVQMVANGLGVTLLPEIALRTGLVDGLDIIVRPLDERNKERELAMIWRRKSAMEDNARLLSEHLAKFV